LEDSPVTSDKPAIIGNDPEFSEWFPIIKPNLDRYADNILTKIDCVLRSNMVSGVNILVKELEEKLAKFLEVDHVIAVSSCTLGMILALQAADLRSKEILLQSFSFSATAHMAYWNNSKIRFIDSYLDTLTIDLEDLKRQLNPKSKAVIGVHMYGNPCYITELLEFSSDNNIPIFFDAAHALGSKYKNKPIGSQGLVNVFSASPTKLFTTIEGGFVATNDDKVFKRIVLGRNYGNYPDYSCVLPGLNGRMSELHAAAGLVTLADIPKFVDNRNMYASKYKEKLKKIPGIAFQEITKNSLSSYKDFSIFIDPKEFGMDRNLLSEALYKENIATKFYFYPPIHQLEAYKTGMPPDLPNTEKLSNSVLSLPIHNFMEENDIKRIGNCIESIHNYADKILNNGGKK
jgi:dTDP-4-amino-4,6-dideoxygalactose transaminase